MSILAKAANTIHLLTVSRINEVLNEKLNRLHREKTNLIKKNENLKRYIEKNDTVIKALIKQTKEKSDQFKKNEDNIAYIEEEIKETKTKISDNNKAAGRNTEETKT